MGQVQAKPIGDNQNEFYMYTVMPTSAERRLKSEKFNVMEYSRNDVEKLFITLTQCYQDNGSEENEKANDFQILKDDKRFLQILSTINRRYRNNYDYFLEKLGEFL
jgi:hypothetical protein